MKQRLRSIGTVAVVAILVLSMVGAGAAAPVPSVVDEDTSADSDDVSQSNTAEQSDVTDVESVTSAVESTSTVTIDDDVDVSVDADADGSDILESVFASLGPGGDLGTLVTDLLDGIDTVDDTDESDETDDETDDDVDEDDGEDTDETDDDDADEDDGEDTDETDEDDTDETDDDVDEDDGEDADETDDDDTDETDGEDTDETDDDDTDDADEDDATDEVDRAAVEQYVHEAVNEERAAHGVDELEYDTELRDIARAHSEDMAERDYLAHENPDGEDVSDRYEAAGYECSVNGYVGGENIAQTWYDTPVNTDDRGTVHYETEEELGYGIVEQWMNSQGHRENLLAEHWENEGIGVYVTDDDQVYVTQNFC